MYQKTNEVFIADGYGNRRVIVLDADTGAFKRMWGGFGNKPVDSDKCPPETGTKASVTDGPGPDQFAIVHAARVSNDGLVYVADRENRRVQVFTIDGKFVNQVFIGRKNPEPGGTTGCVAFSADPQQEFLYVSGASQIVVLNRKTLEILGSFGGASAHHIAADSKGNIYTAETGKRRAQKFVLKGPPPLRADHGQHHVTKAQKPKEEHDVFQYNKPWGRGPPTGAKNRNAPLFFTCLPTTTNPHSSRATPGGAQGGGNTAFPSFSPILPSVFVPAP